MKENISPDGETQEIPNNLSEYLHGKYPASKYVLRLEDTLGAPSDDERFAATDLCVSNPALLPKVVELLRTVTDDKRAPRIRNSIRQWAGNVIRATDPELEKWGKLAGASPDSQISTLGMRLRKARKEKDKDMVAEAEQVLLLGLLVTASHPEFNVVGSLSAVFDALSTEKGDNANIDRRVRKFLLRTTPKNLENLSWLTRRIRQLSDETERQLKELKTRHQLVLDRESTLKDRCREQAQEIAELRKHNDEQAEELERTRSNIAGVKAGADHDMLDARARFRRFLISKLKPHLEDARSGLEADPPFIDTAKQRIGLVDREIRKEIEWLNQFSD